MHATQRGVNRCVIFIDDQDRHHYRRVLREACRKHDVAVHAFVLMDNHVHLLLSASRAGRISLAMRAPPAKRTCRPSTGGTVAAVRCGGIATSHA